MSAEDYLVELSKVRIAGLNKQQKMGKLIGDALFDKDVTPKIYEVLCGTAKDKGFKFHHIQLPS